MLTVAQAAEMTIADTARALNIPAGRIRKWLHRGKVHRTTRGRINIHCLILYAGRNDLPTSEYNKLHAECCDHTH